ncbi:MAG TPA: flagellar brake protein [Rhodocyclaceae bacterium]|nr:flagellar brake protein [Rhodocyclaceae bacterium]
MTEVPFPLTTEEEASTVPLQEPSDYHRYLLHNRAEIVFVLKDLIENRSQITIFFNEGKDLLLTALIAIDDQGLIFDFGSSAETDRKAIEALKLFCVASLNKVKIQFILRGLQQTEYQGRPAFRADYPETLLRLQRREYYRLTMPVTRPLKCVIPLTNKDTGEATQIEINVVDISGGGIAVVSPPDGLVLETGQEYPGCQINLPEVATVTATLRVKSMFEVTLRNGTVIKRSGCEFVNLPGPTLTRIQRYIIRIERERKARESGLSS